MRIFQILFFVAALGLLGLTTGCRGCGCTRRNTNVQQEKNTKDVVTPPTTKAPDATTPPATQPDKPKEDPKKDPKRGGDNPGNF